jgi:hypothetical protein
MTYFQLVPINDLSDFAFKYMAAARYIFTMNKFQTAVMAVQRNALAELLTVLLAWDCSGKG